MQRAGGGEVAQHRIPQGGQQSAALGEHRHQPVSYTHLDVYKRQAHVDIGLVTPEALFQHQVHVLLHPAAGHVGGPGQICLLYTSRCV